MSEENKEVVAQQSGVPALKPEQLALLQKHAGKQKFSTKELLIPQLKIVQTAGGYMKRSDPEYLPEAKEGQFIDTLTLRLREGPISLIVVRFATNYFENKPKMGPMVKMWGEDSSGYDAAAGGDVGVRVTKEGNEIRGVGSYHVLLLNEDGSSLPCMMYLASTSWPAARRLNSLLAALELMSEDGPFTPPTYTRTFTATTVPMSNDMNSWMGWKFHEGPFTQTLKYGDALLQKCIDFETSIDKGIVKVHGPVEDERQQAAAGQGSRQPPRETGTNGSTPPPAEKGDPGADDSIPF